MFTFLSENNVEFFFESEYIYRNIYTDNNYTTFLNFFFILPALMNSSIFLYNSSPDHRIFSMTKRLPFIA